MKKLCVKSVLFIILMINVLPMYGMLVTTARQSQRAAAARRAAQVSRSQVPTRAYSSSQKGGQETSQDNKSWWSRLWHGSSAEDTSKKARQAKENKNFERPWISRIPGFSPNRVELLFEKMMNDVNAGRMPSESDIKSYAEQVDYKSKGPILTYSAKYNIINREDADGHTLLGKVFKLALPKVSMVKFHRMTMSGGISSAESLKYVMSNLAIVDQLLGVGAQLNVKDKRDLRNEISLAIDTIKKVFKAELKLAQIEDFAVSIRRLLALGIYIDEYIDVDKMINFIDMKESVNKYPYEPLGLVSILFVVGNFTRMNDIDGYSLDQMEEMVRNQRIPFMDNDINLIMDTIAAYSARKDRNSYVTFRLKNYSEEISISMHKLHEAVKNGTLRVSLLRKLYLERSRDKRAPQYQKKDDTTKNFIYDLLMESHRVEVAQKLKQYADLCHYASFVKGVASSNTGYQGSRGSSGSSGSDSASSYSTYGGLSTILKMLDLPARTTKVDMEKARRKYLLENHPDKLKVQVDVGYITQAEAHKRIEKVKELNAAYEGYKASEKEARRQSARE